MYREHTIELLLLAKRPASMIGLIPLGLPQTENGHSDHRMSQPENHQDDQENHPDRVYSQILMK